MLNVEWFNSTFSIQHLKLFKNGKGKYYTDEEF